MPNGKEIYCKLFDIKQWIPQFSIDDAKRTALCFRENLIICLKDEPIKNTKPIGAYCILVEPIGPKNREFLVHVQSSMSIDGHFGGSKVISSITEKFHCLEEKRTEFVYESELHEKTIFIAIEDSSYHVKLTRTCPCNNSIETKDLFFCDNDKLISEGVNILLMRYLAFTNYEGTLTFKSINIDGDIAESNYICTPAEHMEIEGHYLNIYTIERKICNEDGTIHTIKTYLTQHGRIVRHNWLDVPYLLKMNPLSNIMVPSKTIRVESPLKNCWAEDLEMLSKYLDMKSSKIAEQTEYLIDHPEVKQMIADYVQTLLVVKPQNVIDFTIQHFKAFTKDPKAWEASTLEEDCNIDVKSQLTEKESKVLCNICGFYVSNSSPKTISLTSGEQQSDEKSSENFIQSIHSEDACEDVSDVQKVDGTSTITTNLSDSSAEIKRICSRCEAIVKVCNKHNSYAKCSGCLKEFKSCTKCFTLDQILQKLRK